MCGGDTRANVWLLLGIPIERLSAATSFHAGTAGKQRTGLNLSPKVLESKWKNISTKALHKSAGLFEYRAGRRKLQIYGVV